jgi:hypothetical protein
MDYFFDESGDWYGRERNRLVLGGLLIHNTHTINSLEAELNLLKSEFNLQYFHANEMPQVALLSCYNIILNSLISSAKAMLRIYPKDTVFKRSRKNSDEIYIELASDLISTMIMGDSSPNINYDMKFHYAFPANIIANINSKKPYHYRRIMEAMILNENKLPEEKKRIEVRLANIKGKSMESCSWFVEKLQENETRAVSDYLWSELALQIQGKETIREIFRAKILDSLDQYYQLSNQQLNQTYLKIQYFSKEQGNVGIEIIDLLCNLIYKNGVVARKGAPSVVKQIYEAIDIEEM